jgi:tetratricopeptide (TPR) repeat protein
MHGNDQDCVSAIEIANRALSDIPRSGEYQEERGQLVYAIGASLIRTGRLEEATSLLDTELPNITSPYWSARVANAKGGAHFYLGQYDRALRFLTLAIERLPDGDAPELRARIHANRGACLNAMGSIRRALDDNERALELSRRSGSGYDTVAAAAGIGIDLFYLGRYDETVRCAREVHELASRLSNIIYQFKGLELEGFAVHALGDFTALAGILDAADKLPKNHDPARTLPRIERLRARLFLARGRREEAAAALRRAIELLEGDSDLEDLWGIEIELAVLNHVEAGDLATLAALSAIAARAREAKNIVVEVDAVAALAQIVTASGRSDAELIRAMTLTLGRAEESGFVDQAARISVGLGGALIDSGDVRAGQSRLVQAQRLLRQIASELSPESRDCFVRSPHVASALREIERRLKPLPR